MSIDAGDMDAKPSIVCPRVQELLGQLRDGLPRTEVLDEVLRDHFELLISQRPYPVSVVSSPALPRGSRHLNHDNGGDGVAIGTVVQHQVSTRPCRRENLVHVESWRPPRRRLGHNRPHGQAHHGCRKQPGESATPDAPSCIHWNPSELSVILFKTACTWPWLPFLASNLARACCR